ncbi:MAG: hypothetical protein ACK5SI_03430 [Planctomycetia bacterium]
MPAPLPASGARSSWAPTATRSCWATSLDGVVLDIHRSGFLYSLILHLVALLTLATCCLGTDPADPRAAISLVARTRGPKFHAVAFHDNAGEAVLRRIARAGRGTYRFQAP